MSKKTHERLSREHLEKIAKALLVIADVELQSTGEATGKFAIAMPPPTYQMMVIPASGIGQHHSHPRDAMGFIRNMVSNAEEKEGKGIIAAVGFASEAWLVKMDRTEATFTDPMTVFPSEHPNRIEVVICVVSTPYGDKHIDVYDLIRDKNGDYARLEYADWQDEYGLEQKGAFETVFDPWGSGSVGSEAVEIWED